MIGSELQPEGCSKLELNQAVQARRYSPRPSPHPTPGSVNLGIFKLRRTRRISKISPYWDSFFATFMTSVVLPQLQVCSMCPLSQIRKLRFPKVR